MSGEDGKQQSKSRAVKSTLIMIAISAATIIGITVGIAFTVQSNKAGKQEAQERGDNNISKLASDAAYRKSCQEYADYFHKTISNPYAENDLVADVKKMWNENKCRKVFPEMDTLKDVDTSAVLERDARSNPVERIRLKSPKGSIDPDTSIFTLSKAIINNNNMFSIKDPIISCDMFGSSGTIIHSLHTAVYQTIPAHSKKTIKNIKLGLANSQVNKFTCIVSGAVALP